MLWLENGLHDSLNIPVKQHKNYKVKAPPHSNNNIHSVFCRDSVSHITEIKIDFDQHDKIYQPSTHVFVGVEVNSREQHAIIDTGSAATFIYQELDPKTEIPSLRK